MYHSTITEYDKLYQWHRDTIRHNKVSSVLFIRNGFAEFFSYGVKEVPYGAKVAAVLTADGLTGLANEDSFNDKFSIYWTLFSRPLSPFETSRDLTPDLTNMSTSGTEHVLVKIGFLKVTFIALALLA